MICRLFVCFNRHLCVSFVTYTCLSPDTTLCLLNYLSSLSERVTAGGLKIKSNYSNCVMQIPISYYTLRFCNISSGINNILHFAIILEDTVKRQNIFSFSYVKFIQVKSIRFDWTVVIQSCSEILRLFASTHLFRSGGG